MAKKGALVNRHTLRPQISYWKSNERSHFDCRIRTIGTRVKVDLLTPLPKSSHEVQLPKLVGTSVFDRGASPLQRPFEESRREHRIRGCRCADLHAERIRSYSP